MLAAVFCDGEPTIEDVLECEDMCLKHQLSVGNKTLIDFLCSNENLAKLIDYATKLPEDPENISRSFKYPLVASKVLSESHVALKFLADSHLPQLMEFLQHPSLEPILCGYFNNIFMGLLRTQK